MTIRRTAASAGVPTGTIYQFFADKEALIQALAVRYVNATPDVIEAAFGRADVSVDSALSRIIDAYADMLRRAPAMRVLWLAGAMDSATARLAAGSDDLIAERLRDRLCRLAGTEGGGLAADWRFLVTLVGDLLRRAFRHEPSGEEQLLERGKRVATLYAADLLESQPGLDR